MTIWMANDWPIMVGGKPFSSIPPYTIIAFELTILFGGLLTLLGLLVVGRAARRQFGKIDPAYSARFSAEEFGARGALPRARRRRGRRRCCARTTPRR